MKKSDKKWYITICTIGCVVTISTYFIINSNIDKITEKNNMERICL